MLQSDFMCINGQDPSQINIGAKIPIFEKMPDYNKSVKYEVFKGKSCQNVIEDNTQIHFVEQRFTTIMKNVRT